MAVVRVNKSKDFTVMKNYHFRNKEMSLKAMGLLSLMLSLPDSWDFSIAGLAAICKDGRDSIKGGMTELEKHGHLIITKLYPNETETGRIEYVYNIYEEPQKTRTEKQGLEIQDIENLEQVNTKKVNTKNKETISKDIVNQKKSTPLIPKKSNSVKKSEQIKTMRAMINAFTENESIREKILEYFNIRLKKGLQPNQWKIILDDLRNYADDNADIAIDKINNAIAGGYMQIIAAWEKDKKYVASKPKFDNTGGRKTEKATDMSKEEFYDSLAKNEDGSLMQF